MLDVIVLTMFFVGGYVSSIYSWPVARLWLIGASAEAVQLRVRAQKLEAKIRGL